MEKWERRDQKRRKRPPVNGRSVLAIINAIVKRAKKVKHA